MKHSVIIVLFFVACTLMYGCKTEEVLKSTEKKIVSFKLNGISNVVSTSIDESTRSISFVLPPLTNVSSITPIIDISLKSTINPASGLIQNFTNPVVYTVTAEDGTTQTYTVTILVQKNIAKDILSLKIIDYSPVLDGKIDATTKKISVSVPNKQRIKSLTPEIVVSERAKISPTGAQDFTNPVTYTVMAEDGSTQTYSVTILSAEKTIKSFVLSVNPKIDGILNENTKEINATVINALGDTFTPTFDIADGAKSNPASKTPQNFKNPVKYTITAEDGSTQIYNVNVSFKETLSTGLLIYYPFNGNTLDASGTNNHATNYGAILTEDKSGLANNAYYFDGSSYLDIANVSKIKLEEYTYSVWVKAKSVLQEPSASIVLSVGGPGGDQAIYLSNVIKNKTAPGSWFSHSYMSPNVSNLNGLPNNFILNKWYHLVVTRTKTNHKLYIDGFLIDENNNLSTAYYGNGLYHSGIIGARFNLSQFFNGYIDDVRIYSRVLNEEEIKYLLALKK